ncbi:MAG TPA: sugar phosphate isomerase/epimerase family protein [Prolixibacteraceae bacterium]|nr:sugar phosphate isomerase/epimerase family protein [Prolixibacteraceae bacterium]
MKTSRRNFITRSVAGTIGVTAGFHAFASSDSYLESATGSIPGNPGTAPFSISIFSKCLHWMGYEEMAEALAKMGFDGIDLTVRPDGHVEPARVETDLPLAVKAAQKAGIQVTMLTTAITDPDDPFTERILKTASSLGIKYYRMGWYFINDKLPIDESLKQAEAKLRKLSELNKKYGIVGEYQNHSGAGGSGVYLGGPVWDIAALLRKIGSEWLGSQYDIMHATIEGTNSWPAGLKYIAPYIRTIDIKNFSPMIKDGKLIRENVPLKKGTVDYKKFLAMVKTLGISCPLSLHLEYPLGDAEKGSRKPTMKKEEILAYLADDLNTLKTWLKDAELL